MIRLRGCCLRGILIAEIEELKTFPVAIRSVFPELTCGLDILHLVRDGHKLCTWTGRSLTARRWKRTTCPDP